MYHGGDGLGYSFWREGFELKENGELNGAGELDTWNEPLRVETLTNQLEPPPSGSLADAFSNMLEQAKAAAAAAQAAAAAEIQAIAEGTTPPSELTDDYEIRVGSEVTTGVPITQAEAVTIEEGTWEESPYAPPKPILAGMAPGGIAEGIANSAAGDLVEKIGLPRGAAPVLVGLAVVVGIAQSIQFAGDGLPPARR